MNKATLQIVIVADCVNPEYQDYSKWYKYYFHTWETIFLINLSNLAKCHQTKSILQFNSIKHNLKNKLLTKLILDLPKDKVLHRIKVKKENKKNTLKTKRGE